MQKRSKSLSDDSIKMRKFVLCAEPPFLPHLPVEVQTQSLQMWPDLEGESLQ